MEQAQRRYLAIDLKSFYASVECADRDLNPLTTNLVVADESKTEKTICLAVSPSLKSIGLGGRCRLFEVIAAVKAENERRKKKAPNHTLSGESADAQALENDASLALSYIVAPPRMARYMEVSAQIYAVYLRYVAPEDIFAYSVDEVFIDVTGYLQTYKMDAHALAVTMIRAVLQETGITATCGIGTNLYLAKIAMDILAKKAPPDADGVRIAWLDEARYKEQLWNHRPIKDFWRVGPGTARKLAQYYIYTMGDLARLSTYNQELLYRLFGIDAEILIDHAWGVEPTKMEDVKAYRPSSNSICEGQVLTHPYPFAQAKTIVWEMADALMYQLTEKGLVTNLLTLDVGYDRENCDLGIFRGEAKMDRYGRCVPPPAHGSIRLDNGTNLGSVLTKAATDLFVRIADPNLSVRRITITACNVEKDTGFFQMDLFTDTKAQEKEKALQEAMLSVRQKYGKNAVLKGKNFEEGATMRERNGQIGGHKA